ncbi:MAG TPA: VOC family protein [Mycobacteriales bacterium]|nr:VOC family protein [Mycobacteriales bacterium]
MPTITAHIVVDNAERAAQWYRDAFGAVENRRIPTPGGKYLEISLQIGDSPLMIADEFPDMGVLAPQRGGAAPVALHIATDDVDALWQRAVAAGAEVHQPLQDAFWGDRHGQVIDPFGHRWGFSQHLRDVPDDEITVAVAAMFAD